MIYHPPKIDKGSETMGKVSTVSGTLSSLAAPVAGAIGGGIAASGAGASIVGGVVGGGLAASGLGLGASAGVATALGAGTAGVIGTGAATATVAGGLAAGAGATAATGIGLPIAAVLALAAATAGGISAINKAKEKKEVAAYEQTFKTYQDAKSNNQQSQEQNYYNIPKNYNQQGVNTSIGAISRLSNPSSLKPLDNGVAINNNRLI